MVNYNHTCKICGKGYNACDTCLTQKNYTPWRAIGCTQDHFQVYMVLFEYGNGTLEKADAKRMLSKVDIEGWENYPEHNRLLIAKILKEDEKPVDDIYKPIQADEPVAIEIPSQVAQAHPQGNKQAPKTPYNNYSKFRK